MKKYDLCVKTGSYTDKQGNEKISWENIGILMEGTNGNPFILMKPYFNPAGIAREEGRDNIIISLFEKGRQNNSETDDFNSAVQNYEENSVNIPF